MKLSKLTTKEQIMYIYKAKEKGNWMNISVSLEKSLDLGV